MDERYSSGLDLDEEAGAVGRRAVGDPARMPLGTITGLRDIPPIKPEVEPRTTVTAVIILTGCRGESRPICNCVALVCGLRVYLIFYRVMSDVRLCRRGQYRTPIGPVRFSPNNKYMPMQLHCS
jgi:hypothetical protein